MLGAPLSAISGIATLQKRCLEFDARSAESKTLIDSLQENVGSRIIRMGSLSHGASTMPPTRKIGESNIVFCVFVFYLFVLPFNVNYGFKKDPEPCGFVSPEFQPDPSHGDPFQAKFFKILNPD